MSTAPQAISKKEIDNRFTYHPPTPEQAALYEDIRSKAKSLATFLNRNVPDGRNKSLAITSLEDVVMRANAAVAQAVPDPETGELPAPVAKGPGRPRKSAAVPTPAPEKPAASETKAEPVAATSPRPRRARGAAAATA